jgi:hypothetical protein
MTETVNGREPRPWRFVSCGRQEDATVSEWAEQRRKGTADRFNPTMAPSRCSSMYVGLIEDFMACCSGYRSERVSHVSPLTRQYLANGKSVVKAIGKKFGRERNGKI